MSDSKSSPRHDEDLPGGSPPSDRDRAIADAIANYLDRASQEEFLDVDIFCRQYPSIAQDLRPLLQSLNAMDDTFSPPRGANAPEPLPPALSGHRILSEIGAGGMGRVFLAMDEGLNRKVAIKTLNARFANDFAMALHADSDFRLTSFGELVGTPNYFSPEQTAAQRLDARTDIFSLGTILYESLTGQLPFSERSLANQLQSIRTADPVLPRRLNPDIPGDLQDICLKA